MAENKKWRLVRHAFTLLELLVAIAIIAILLRLTLAGVQRVRESAARAQCQNNIRQLALGLHQYHDANGAFPTGHRSLVNRDLMPLSGWTLSVLPYIDQQALFEQSRAAYRKMPLPWFDSPHAGMSTVVSMFNCPSDFHRIIQPLRFTPDWPICRPIHPTQPSHSQFAFRRAT